MWMYKQINIHNLEFTKRYPKEDIDIISYSTSTPWFTQGDRETSVIVTIHVMEINRSKQGRHSVLNRTMDLSCFTSLYLNIVSMELN